MKKTLITTTILGVIFSASNALACAGCLDIYPEVIVLDSKTTEAIQTSVTEDIRLSNISCTKPNYFSNLKESECTIIGSLQDDHTKDIELKFSGEAALALHSQLNNLTVEIDGRVEDSWQRDGARTPITLKNQTTDSSTVYIPWIHSGYLTCPEVRNTVRCEIELTVLNVSLIGVQ